MKRLWLAVGIFAAILALCLTSLIHQRRQINILLEELDAVIAAFEEGDAEHALLLSHTLEDDFAYRTRYFPVFMAHDNLAECRESLALIPSILKDGDAEEFHMESTRCRVMLERIASSELPTLQNIL
jgi:hypothetical protein